MDDVLCLWTGSLTELQDFLFFINSFYNNVQFTLEIGGSSINFRYLSISIRDGRYDFAIYRKPTSTDIILHDSSFHPPSHKHAAIHSMLHRLISIPLSPSAFATEVGIIKYIANNNNISFDIDALIRRKSITRALDTATSLQCTSDSRKDDKFIRLPFLGDISFKISRILRSFNYRPTFYTLNTTKKQLSKLKDPIPSDSRSGVYKLCLHCPAFYIGETSRKFKTRLSEHKPSLARNQSADENSSRFVIHLNTTGHPFHNDSLTILHSEENYKKRTTLEAMEIGRALRNNLPILNDKLPAPSSLTDLAFYRS